MRLFFDLFSSQSTRKNRIQEEPIFTETPRSKENPRSKEEQEYLDRQNQPETSFETFRGTWGVVTGSSRGLGLGFAKALAKRGLNLILISRTQSSLDASKEEIQSKYPVRVKTIAADLSVAEKRASVVQRLQEEENISILINNIGGAPSSYMKTQSWDLFYQISPSMFQAYYQLNIAPMLNLCHALLPQMIANNRGYILNVSSLNGFSALPQATAYCTVKSMVIAYSANLMQELSARNSHVAVDCVCPGMVATDGIRRGGNPGKGVPDPFDFADQTLKFARTPYIKIPWFEHWEDRFSYGETGHFDLN